MSHLLQFHWATELDSRQAVSALGPSRQAVSALGPHAIRALETYDWPHNLDELFEHSRRILAYHEHGGLRPAAAALGITHQTLAGHLARIDFPTIDPAEREVPLRPRRRASRAAM